MGDVVQVALKQSALHSVCGPEVLGVLVRLHHFGHAAERAEQPEVPHELLVHSGGHWLAGLEVLVDRQSELACEPLRPEELLEVQPVQRQVVDIAHGIGTRAVVVYAEQGARRYHIVAPVRTPELQRGDCLRALLDLVEEKERPSRRDLMVRISEPEGLHHAVHRQVAPEYGRRAGGLLEVDGDRFGIALPAESFDRVRLTDLPRPSHNEALLIGTVFPHTQLVLDLSLQHVETFRKSLSTEILAFENIRSPRF